MAGAERCIGGQWKEQSDSKGEGLTGETDLSRFSRDPPGFKTESPVSQETPLAGHPNISECPSQHEFTQIKEHPSFGSTS